MNKEVAMQFPKNWRAPRPNRDTDVAVTYFEHPQKFWFRKIRSTDKQIAILNCIREKCSSNLLKRPCKSDVEKDRELCKSEVLCAFHVHRSDYENSDYAIDWQLPNDSQVPGYMAADAKMKENGIEKGDLIYARSRYIQNRENGLFECNNRGIVQMAYLPDEDFLNLHLLVQYIDEGEDHTEWIPVSDVCRITSGNLTLLLDEPTSPIDDETNHELVHPIQVMNWWTDDTMPQNSRKEALIQDAESKIDNDIEPSEGQGKLDENTQLGTFNEFEYADGLEYDDDFEYIDDNIYCGELSDFGLRPGGLILARCSNIKDTSPFHRGKIMNMKFEPVIGLHVQVFFYDYGNTEWVHILDTRIMPRDLVEIPPLAEEASLYELYPTWIFAPDEQPTDHGWSEAACEEFRKLISICDQGDLTKHSDTITYIDLFDNSEEYYSPYPLHMQIVQTLRRRVLVNLSCYPIGRREGRLSRGDPISVRDMLLYQGLGCISDPRRMGPSWARN